MKTKVLQVFYNENGLPFKDQERTVHFPIVGSGFMGASNTTQIKFYFKEIGDDAVKYVAVSKLPNGKVGSKVLENYFDSELNEPYALLELDSYYTQYKGDLFISLQGYQGGVQVTYDEDTELYEIEGTPTIQATGSIKFTNNYATQFVGSGEEENVTLQQLLAIISDTVLRYNVEYSNTLAEVYNEIGTQICVLNIEGDEYLCEMSDVGRIVLYDIYSQEWYAFAGASSTTINDILQDSNKQIIATKEDLENFGNLFTYKGAASVSEINALTDIGNGWCYNLTDSGTLTLGNLQVEQGDIVAFNGSAWTKLPILGQYYTKQEGQAFENNVREELDEFDDRLSSVASGSPKGVYATLSDLQTAYPTGTTGIYVVSGGTYAGHWFYWNGSAWTDGGVYQAAAIDQELFYNRTTIHFSNFTVVARELYIAEQVRFESGKKYKIKLHFDNDVSPIAQIGFSASTVNENFKTTLNNSDIIQSIVSGIITVEIYGNDVYIVFECSNDAYGLAYFVGTTNLPHTLYIEEYKDIDLSKLKKVNIAKYLASADYYFVMSFLMKENVKYYVKLKTDYGRFFEIRKINSLQITEYSSLLQAYSDGENEYVFELPQTNAELFAIALDRSVESDFNNLIEIYYDDQDTKVDNLIPYKNIVQSKLFPIEYYDYNPGNLKGMFNVNFESGKKYIFRFSTSGAHILGTLYMSTFNGPLSTFSQNIVDENFIQIGSPIKFNNEMYYVFEPTANAESLLFWVRPTETGFDFNLSIIEYSDEEKYNINPLYDKRDCSDPTVWKDGNVWYCLGSPWNDTNYHVLMSLDNGLHWEDTREYLFDDSITNRFAEYGYGIWAPDIFKIGDNWLMYLALMKNDYSNSIIVVCKSKNPFGKFSYVATLQDQSQTGIADTIDPFVVWGEDNKLYMFYGSTNGIHRIELEEDGLSVKENAIPIHVAGLSRSQDQTREKVFEGSSLFYFNDYWYLLVSSGNYYDNTYKLKIGRSKTITGTFKDKDGNNMIDGYGTVILETETDNNDVYNGPGHCSRAFVGKDGKVYIYYHCHYKLKEYTLSVISVKSRLLFLQSLIYEDGWFTCKNKHIEKLISLEE